MNAEKLVIDLGQCDPDHGSIKRLVESLGFSVIRAHSANEAKRLVTERKVELVLVNRIFDADGGSGLDCIRELVEMTRSPGFLNPKMVVMLVSNYPEYQDQAVKLGAAMGFGKAQLRDAATAGMLKSAVMSD
jgi:CheY-like chemotaxis protein